MGSMEIEMDRYKWMAATRYVTYRSKNPGQHLDSVATLQIFVDAMNVPGASSSIRGKGNKNLPQKIKVTVEWEDVPDGTIQQ